MKVVRPQTDCFVVSSALGDPCEDVVVAGRLSVVINVDRRTILLKERDHFVDMRINDQRVRFAVL